ncbi:hypothetical protein ACG9XL_11370 [Acinetobacter nosocomialis]|uniref:hypothetical protein n=1 Tax=Acinetobacter nosocomialis TaxID=106654 RepID=UPI00207C841D|nr:hypothetical protein [uncultured Acinetobacter sp.]
MAIKQIHIKLTDETHKQLKISAVLEGVSVQDLVSRLIKEYVAEGASKVKQ